MGKYKAARRLTVGGEEVATYEPGDEVPGAEGFENLEALVASGVLTTGKVEVPDDEPEPAEGELGKLSTQAAAAELAEAEVAEDEPAPKPAPRKRSTAKRSGSKSRTSSK